MNRPLTDAELQVFGKALRPLAHETAAALRQTLTRAGYDDIDAVLGAAMQSDEVAARLYGTYLTIPIVTVASAAAVLMTLPRPRRGRTRKASTEQALKLVEQKQQSVRGAARLIAAMTGEPAEQIRSRLQGVQRRKPKGG